MLPCFHLSRRDESFCLYLRRKDTFVASNTVTVCGDNHGLGYSVIKSSRWKMFYKSCSNATTLTD